MVRHLLHLCFVSELNPRGIGVGGSGVVIITDGHNSVYEF